MKPARAIRGFAFAFALVPLFAACAREPAQSPPRSFSSSPSNVAITSVSPAPSSTAPDAHVCLRSAPDVVGYDLASDTITLCAKSSCVALPFGGPARRTESTPSTTLHLVERVFTESPSPTDALVTTGATVRLKSDAKHWAPIPASPTKRIETLWISKNGALALVLRTTGSVQSPKPTRELFDLVDLAAHAHLAHAEKCNFHIEAGASVDANETLAAVELYHDNPIIFRAFVDLVHGKFVPIGNASTSTYDECTADDFGRIFDVRENLEDPFDASHLRKGRVLLALDGSIVSHLDGDFPAAIGPLGPMHFPEYAVDDAHRVLVDAKDGRVCAGVMRVVAATTAEPPPLSSPRCIAHCN